MGRNPNRLDRINEELKKEISQVINYELKNSNVTGMISVTKVKISPDLRYAKVYVSIFNSKSKKNTMEGLKKSEGFIRTRIANTINLRVTPQLRFIIDDSEEQGEKIDAILRQLKEENK
ncbi:MAG: 30S ribosome-binding factor RbfA [Clostridia bacterium]|nr:30S ribosome-binding factor RbfA [Clostridia bacterium]